MRKRITASILVLGDRNAAVAHVEIIQYRRGGLIIDSATGSAKREPGDVRDDGIASDLAVGRALVNLGRSLLQKGNMQVSDAVRASQAAEHRRLLRAQRARAARLRKPVPLPVPEIEARFGSEAADRAAARRARI